VAGLAALWHRAPANFVDQLIELKGRVAEYHFDDGYDDVMKVADILEKRLLRGVFFIVPSWLGLEGQATKADVLELHMRGHTIGNHTMHHAWMPKVPVAVQLQEWRAAQIALEDIIGDKPDRFAWPYGLAGHVTLGIRPRGIEPHEVYAPRDSTRWDIHKMIQRSERFA
jgi:peptidoglycan/xylan/chitin deacetylase (PgdA/CDA1 family)